MPATTITISDTNPHNLYDVLTGKDTTGVSVGHVVSASAGTQVRSLAFQADPGNAGSVLVGDASVSSTDYGAKLNASTTMSWGPVTTQSINLKTKVILASAATQKLNVSWEY